MAGSLADAPYQWPKHVPLICPRCAYSLRRLESAGVDRCPECGETLDYVALRALYANRLEPPPLHRLLPRLLWLPSRFFNELPVPRWYMMVGRPSYLGAAVATLVVVGILGIGAMTAFHVGVACIGLALLAVCLAQISAGHMLAGPWIRWLLRRSGHPRPALGQERVQFWASPILLPIALAMVLEMMVVAAVPAGDHLVPLEYAFALAAAPAVLVAGLWLLWAWILMRAFEAETRGLSAVPAPLVVLNPGLFTAAAVVLPFVIWAMLS